MDGSQNGSVREDDPRGSAAGIDTAAIAPRALRDVLGTFPTGVVIVTAKGQSQARIGLTINSFSSLSLDPPLVAWALRRRSPSLEAFRHSRHFAINVLSARQEALAVRFASAIASDRFGAGAFVESAEGPALLDGALGTLVCANEREVDGGDHVLFIGRVLRAARSTGSPLVFHEGRFGQLART